MADKTYTPEEIAEIVLESLRNDQNDETLCRKHNIEENQLLQWRNRLTNQAHRLFITMAQSPVEAQFEQALEKIGKQRAFGWSLFHDLKILGVPQPTIVFDIGANIGQTSRTYAAAWPKARIHAFEPIRATFSKLEANIRRHKRIAAHHCALGDEEAQVTVQLSQADRSLRNSLLVAPEGSTETEQVQVTTVDTFCRQHEITRIDFLKIDAEGYDLKVLQGSEALLMDKKIKAVLVEVGFHEAHERFVPLQDIIAYLCPQGFTLAGLYDQSIYKKPRTLALANALFIHKSCRRLPAESQ